MTPFEIKCINELQTILDVVGDCHNTEQEWLEELSHTEVTEPLGDSVSATLMAMWYDRGQFK